MLSALAALAVRTGRRHRDLLRAQSPHDQYFFERRNEMVAGVVRPPALDITNEELVRSHLHAIWLAEAKLALSPDIPEILDLTGTGYPLKQEIHDIIDPPALAVAAHAPMKRVLDQILASVDGRKPTWMSDPDDFVSAIAQRAPEDFDRALIVGANSIILPERN